MYRMIKEDLRKWKASEYRKPLILQGARQVGKTYVLLEFGREEYDNVAYFNFETTPKLASIFEEELEPKKLLPLLEHSAELSIVRERTLIIFDEVQLCERAVTSLKYFCEMAPEYHIVAAGSLLGVAVNRSQFSFPVGKVEEKTMHPMGFEEFLLAMEESNLVQRIRKASKEAKPLPTILHDKAMELYRKFLIVGGMPECVKQFAETKDYILIRNTQNNILSAYLSDMSKYNINNEIKKTRQVYNSITVQLSKKNSRFLYKMVKRGGRAAEFENAIEWLSLSGIVSRCFRVEQIQKPLENYKDIDSFKVYVSDVGLLCAKKEVSPQDILFMSEKLDDFKGGLAENYISNQLTINGYTHYYWESSGIAEIDFIIVRDNALVPVEVKAADNTRSKSLAVYITKMKPDYAIRVSSKNFGFENGIRSIPLYAAFCI